MIHPHDPDGYALARLEAWGIDLNSETVIEFAIDVPDNKSARNVNDLLSENGYDSKIDDDAGEPDYQEGVHDEEQFGPSWTVYAKRLAVPTHEFLVRCQAELRELVTPLGGTLDGWGIDMPHPLPTRGRLLGLDPGAKRLGVAVCDIEQQLAAPLTVINRSSRAGDGRALEKLVAENEPVGLVVGLPVFRSGEEGTQARRAREFGTWAAERLGLPVTYWDERNSSTIAEGRQLAFGLSEKQRKKTLDAVAAQVMLQDYLDAPDRSLWHHERPAPEFRKD